MGFHLSSLLNVQLILNRLFSCFLIITSTAHMPSYFSSSRVRIILKCRDNDRYFLVLLPARIKSYFANLLILFYETEC